MQDLGYYSELYRMIIVCPDGGYRSWYINSPVSTASQMENFIASELPAYIDKNYPTISNRSHRGIAGLSMGGHGAIMIAMKYPQRFASASSISGTLDLEQIVGKYESHLIFGERISNPEPWTKNSVLNLAAKLKTKKLALLIDCGNKDYFLRGNKALRKILVNRKIDHEYIERYGDHNWEYWTSALPYHLLYFHRIFNKSTDWKK